MACVFSSPQNPHNSEQAALAPTRSPPDETAHSGLIRHGMLG